MDLAQGQGVANRQSKDSRDDEPIRDATDPAKQDDAGHDHGRREAPLDDRVGQQG